MFFDLNVPVVAHELQGAAQPRKGKGKQPQQSPAVTFTPPQISAIEARIDLLIHLGYHIIAFNQIIEKKIDPKTHANILAALLPRLKTRPGVIFLKRLTIVLDEDSEKGFGLTSANASLVEPYDLIALVPTTASTFSSACLTHSLPSPLTAHIISLPLTAPRLPFHLKHTLVRTAIKNGVVFEINYGGALGDTEANQTNLGVSDSSVSAKRNWWAAAREVVRVTKGKGIIISGGVYHGADYRAPKDVQNLITLLGLAQNMAHDACTTVPKSLTLRAQTRKTYRAILSEPRLVIPKASGEAPLSTQQPSNILAALDDVDSLSSGAAASSTHPPPCTTGDGGGSKKRGRPESATPDTATPEHRAEGSTAKGSSLGAPSRKKKKKDKVF